MAFLQNIWSFLGPIVLLAAILLIARWFEVKIPLEKQSTSEVIGDWKLAAVQVGMSNLLAPMTTVCGIMVINTAGGGLIHLRADGWWFLLSVILVIVVIDLWAYIGHRAQHKFPVLWAMHSLHHSAEALSAVTGARHFWLENAINTAFLPVVGIVFQIPSEVVTVVGALYFLPDGLSHLNIRCSLGRFALVVNNPQYHRIHHSVEPQHRDKNFCKMFPLFDVIFGTAWKPGKDEFPKTGLLPRETASGFLDGIIWPVRHLIPVQKLNLWRAT